MFRTAIVIAASSFALACAHAPVKPPVKPQTVKLFSATPDRETESLKELREDLRFASDLTDGAAHVVAVSETPLLESGGGDVWLSGDEANATEFSVDNVILLEISGADGAFLGRAAVGYHEGLRWKDQEVDAVGQRAFRFEPRQVNLRPILPDRGTFRIKATVLDVSGVGRVSDVYVHVEPRATSEADELRD